MKFWKAERKQDRIIITNFLTEADAIKYAENEGGSWTIEEYEAMSLDSNKEEFLNFFGFTTFSMSDTELRNELECILCTTKYLLPEVVGDKGWENFESYTISYCLDQWWACSLNKSVKVEGSYYLQEVLRGEGDTQLDALCALFIIAHDLVETEVIEGFRKRAC